MTLNLKLVIRIRDCFNLFGAGGKFPLSNFGFGNVYFFQEFGFICQLIGFEICPDNLIKIMTSLTSSRKFQIIRL